MPPRFSYWTILAGGLPTAFRAAERDELMPTFRRIQDKHPDAEMKWFARGRLWTSPEAAQEALKAARARRDRDWRPGGEHRDPRQKYKDAKRARNAAHRSDRFRRKSSASTGSRTRPAPDSPETVRRDFKRKAPVGRRRHEDKREPPGKPPGKRQR